jgi:excinuclease UvrABC nuclease subunit
MEAGPFEFDRNLPVDPSGDLDAFLKDVPARWAIYLMSDAEHRPVQLLSVKNLRYSIRRRLGPEAADQPAGKRADVRQIVRHVAWRRVDSAFEADCLYLEAARQVFPETYQGMVGLRPAWFVHVDPDAPFPRYVKTCDLSIDNGLLLGPLPDKHAAARLIEDVTDWFDLCRYYNVLTEAPTGRACAYKEMGRCPAPCDGSISMTQYRRLIDWSVEALVSPQAILHDQEQRMRAAAADLRFESARKIKAYFDSLSRLGTGAYRHIRRLEDFVFLSIQSGPRKATARVFLVTPGAIEPICSLVGKPDGGELLRLAQECAAIRPRTRPDLAGAQRIGIVAHHLFTSAKDGGVILRLDSADEKAVLRAYRQLSKTPEPAQEHAGEGVVADLQAM